MTETIIISLINSGSLIAASIITTLGIIIGANKIAERKRLQASLLVAYNDILTLYTIEKFHSEMNIATNNVCNKSHVRKLVKEENGLLLSGTNTTSKVERKITMLALKKE